MHVNYAEVRSTPISSVLAHYGLEGRKQGNMIVLKQCPLSSHTSKEVDTFKASLAENLWVCHSRSCRNGKKRGGDVIDLVCEIENLGPLDAAKKLAGMGVTAIDNRLSTNEMAIVNKPLNFTLQANPDHPEIQSRGISIETARSYGVGYYRSKQGTASMDDRIIFPLHESGVLVGYIGRTVLPVTPENPKWKMGKGVVKTMLFGLERCDPAQLLILTESPWATLWLRQRGIQGASLLGKDLTEGQEEAIAPFRMLSLALDNDDAGREATEKLLARLRVQHAVKRSAFRE